MTIGEKIKLIRVFRNMKQQELGVLIGLDEKGAANRIAQYETNYRAPKKDALLAMAKALNINPLNFISEASGSAEDIMQTFFWLDEDKTGFINLFQLEKSIGDKNEAIQSAAYVDSEAWPDTPPVGLWFNYGVVDDFMKKWMVRKNELKSGKITKDEYLEWKLNWPDSCDNYEKLEQKKG